MNNFTGDFRISVYSGYLLGVPPIVYGNYNKFLYYDVVLSVISRDACFTLVVVLLSCWLCLCYASLPHGAEG